MAGECGVVSGVVEPLKSFVFGVVKKYVDYVRSYEKNLVELRSRLKDLCNKKVYIIKKVKEGNAHGEDITPEAASWLEMVEEFTEDKKLKGLMYKDTETAKYVVKMMKKGNLKRRIRAESEMQQLVVKVMKKLQEEMKHYKEEEEEEEKEEEDEVEVRKMRKMRKMVEADYKRVAEVVVEVMKDTNEFKKLMKDDLEMEEFFREVVGNVSDDKEWRNQEDEESNVGEPKIDGFFIKGRGLKQELDNNTKKLPVCCSVSFSPCYDFHDRYLISKAAKLMGERIQEDFIRNCPVISPLDRVTSLIRSSDSPIRSPDSKPGMGSRERLLHQILEKLNDDRVHSVGVFGMGGSGKTTLAKEVMKRVKDAFAIKVMVEVSDAPDLVRIQAAIADSIDLPLHNVDNVAQRAIRLYNRLISEKEKKILVVLDNVWKKLNLDEIGIPDTCKLLLTAREREVCRVMDVQYVNIFEVGVMNINEARELFKSLAQNQAGFREYKNVVERLLSKCGGLPLAILATANSLKDKDLASWVKFADDLEKPISSQLSVGYHDIFTILNTSYKFIQPDGKRIFFLLVCLSPLGSSVSAESLMRYGIGLNLFEFVNKLSEAMGQAVTWVNELMLASMLLEGDVKGDVKIHDIVRDFAISYAAKEEEHKFIVESLPRWLDDETLNKYTAISLTSKNDYSRLSGVEICKLQILILKGDLSPDFDDDFFNGMLNLKVLVVSNMNFRPSLPESMRKLKKLRTLCMESCKLRNIELVGELVNLLVLSLRGSSMENIPNEFMNLRKLRLLDLGGCTSSNKVPLIPMSVLNTLSTLEGLYMYNERQPVLEKKSEYEDANDVVNISLPYLNALEMKIGAIEELPFDGQTIKNLDKFKISIGSVPGKDFKNFWYALDLGSIDNVSGFFKKGCLEGLFKKADYLKMAECGNLATLVILMLGEEGFRSLRSLHLRHCDDIKCIVDGRTMNKMIVFPRLESLKLEFMECLEAVCYGDVSPRSFSNLQTIKLSHLYELRYGLPLIPRNVEEIHVSCCQKLEFIFMEDEEVPTTKLPFLKTLELEGVDHLLSLVRPEEFSNSYDALRGTRLFFGEKIGLPSLEMFRLESSHNVGTLWSKEIHTPGFQNLKDIEIINCQRLSSVGSASVFYCLLQLENLCIRNCKEMCEVISHEIEESEICEQCIVFPHLKSLELKLLRNLESFYGGRSKLEFPQLKRLDLEYLESMKMFAKLENSSALFSEKIDFPSLEELKVISVNDEVTGLWDKQSFMTKSNPAPMLRQLLLGSSVGLRPIPIIVLKNLSSLTLTDFDGDKVAFSSSDFGEKGGFVWIYSQLPKLEGLKVEGSESLKELLFGKDDYNPVNDALTTSFCGQFKTLELNKLPSLNPIPLHLFKNIASLALFELKWNYLISADVLNSLHQLQFLSIEGCHNMEVLVINVGPRIKLPSLKQLRLNNLNSFVAISSVPKNEAAFILPFLETLEIHICPNLAHFWHDLFFAPRLQDVSIEDCDNMQHLLEGNLEDTIELPALRRVSSRYCSNIKAITSGSLTAPKLWEVQLHGCDKMECFFSGNQNHDGDLQLPSLEVVDISNCHNLRAFSPRRVVAPKLTQITYDEEEYSMLPFDDLNHFLMKFNPIGNSIDEEELDDGDSNKD